MSIAMSEMQSLRAEVRVFSINPVEGKPAARTAVHVMLRPSLHYTLTATDFSAITATLFSGGRRVQKHCMVSEPF